MTLIIDDSRPIFVQIAERIEDDIIQGRLPEESQVPSKNEFASFIRLTLQLPQKASTCWWTKESCIRKSWNVCRRRRPRRASRNAKSSFRAIRGDHVEGSRKAGDFSRSINRYDSERGCQMTSHVVEVKKLTKSYGNVTAVNEVSFTLEPDKIYGSLGEKRRRQNNDHAYDYGPVIRNKR